MLNRELELQRVSFKAFTLAEVLITLGIIGIVAVMTIPMLIQDYKNLIVETKLKKIYTVMNQTIIMAEAEHGTRNMWDFTTDDFYDKYFAPYLKVFKTDTIDSEQWRRIYFTDGSLLLLSLTNNKDFVFYPNAKNFDIDSFITDPTSEVGKSSFLFLFNQNDDFDDEYAYHSKNKGFVPYAYRLERDLSNMLEGFRHSCNKDEPNRGYCTYYIYINGWKIPKDYPFKVR